MNSYWTAFEVGSDLPLGLAGTIPEPELAFAWGYLDLIDSAGSGVVLIWGFALPFLPGTVAREREGLPASPRLEPAVALSVYRAGRPDFYLLQRQQPVDSADPFAQRIALDAVTIDLTDGVDVDIHADLPGGERLTGRIGLDGPATRLQLPHWALNRSDHRWQPRRLGDATADLRTDRGWSFAMRGRGYHDGNLSRVGLTELDLTRWTWGRLPHPGGDRIFYLLERRDGRRQQLLIDVGPGGDGTVQEPTVAWGPLRRGRWGMTYPTRLTIGDTGLDVRSCVDDGPFYQRFVVQGQVDGVRSVGVMEQVEVDRMDRGWTAPLTRMAIHDPNAPAPFCALFNGPHRGGIGRLLRQWAGSTKR